MTSDRISRKAWGSWQVRIPQVIGYGLGCLGVLLASFVPGTMASGQTPEFWLITPEEAAACPGPSDDAVRPRGLFFDDSRQSSPIGPIIEVLSPQVDSSITSPFEILVRFATRTARVNIDSLKVQVLKLIPLDITERVRPYVSVQGIKIPDARLPSGEHTVRITVSDEDGHLSTKQMTVTVP